MDKIKKAEDILRKIGLPERQQSEMCALTLLGLSGLKEREPWKSATNSWVRIHDMIEFINSNYGRSYKENTRETFRKQALHHFRNAALIEDNGMATNSPNYSYRITDEFLEVLRSQDSGTNGDKAVKGFTSKHPSLVSIYASKKKMQKMPVRINGKDYTFGAGKHNQLQKAVIEEFAPRFAPGSECLYVGDTEKKDLHKDSSRLDSLGFDITLHEKMPDVVLYREDKDWLYFVEAVTSVGPMSADRVNDLEKMTSNVKSGKIFITAFPNFATFKKFSSFLAWETSVWIADTPEHIIHFDGDKSIAPKKP